MFTTNMFYFQFVVETNGRHSPAEYDYEVHDVPAVPQVRAFMENETKGQQLDPRLETEDPDEVRLCLLLWK